MGITGVILKVNNTKYIYKSTTSVRKLHNVRGNSVAYLGTLIDPNSALSVQS